MADGAQILNLDIGTMLAEVKTDLKTEMKDLKAEMTSLRDEVSSVKNEIFAWRTTVEVELTKLNGNMDRVLNQISQHEIRILKLEESSQSFAHDKKDLSEKVKLGLWALKAGIITGLILASTFGITTILKYINP